MMIISGGRGGCHGNHDNYSNAPPLYFYLSASNFTTPQIEEIDTLSLY